MVGIAIVTTVVMLLVLATFLTLGIHRKTKRDFERRIAQIENCIGLSKDIYIFTEDSTLINRVSRLENKKDSMVVGNKEAWLFSFDIHNTRNVPQYKPTSEIVQLILDHLNLKITKTDATPEKYEIKEERPILSADKLRKFVKQVNKKKGKK